MNPIEDKELVQRCLLELKKQMGYAEHIKLSQRDMEHLSEAIEARTKILISLSTLKRILNGQFDRLPQTSTLNALTIFIGYTGWHDFKTRKLLENPVSALTDEIQPPSNQTNSRSKAWIGVGLVVLIIIIAFLLKTPLLGSQNAADNIQFSAKQTSSQNIPNSVVFNYNIDKVEADSFHFQQSWNERTKIGILKNSHTLTDIYYEPGYHKAKLIANGKVLKEIGVNITAKDWFCYSKASFTELRPQYFSKGNAIHDGVLGVTDEAIEDNNIDFQKDQIYFYTFCPKLMEVAGDNFSYKARFRLRKIKNTLCPWIMTEVFCENSFMYFTNTTPGCIGEINAKISEHEIRGKTTDLSPFGCDLMQWQDLEIRVINKNVTIYLAHKKIFEKPYEQSLGLIAGIGFTSNGICEVDKVSLEDLKGRVVYGSGF
ncbi:hypothetical protein [Emticicia sp. BO119]|uniref:hypothetical protein n=1 Tax=Emticicia sp. BO119 TaxID=2757768 RepID=UPI0015F08CAD|nr:hypothetical protein [Emticicia sp. BO119]MBA4852855.1 hypothetical protein [Emticicia sp. BO119]